MKSRLISLLVSLTLSQFVYAQSSIVTNGTFTNRSDTSCPFVSDTTNDQLAVHCSGWQKATKATPDYFSCVQFTPNISASCGIPQNFKGFEYDYENDYEKGGYAGIVVHSALHDPTYIYSWSEYLWGDLDRTRMINGNTYRVTFYASLSESSTKATKLGFRMEKDYSRQNTYEALPDPDYETDAVVTSRTWVPITGFYTSKGNEDALLIGHFADDLTTSDVASTYTFEQDLAHPTYYYIDNVTVSDCNGDCGYVTELTSAKCCQFLKIHELPRCPGRHPLGRIKITAIGGFIASCTSTSKLTVTSPEGTSSSGEWTYKGEDLLDDEIEFCVSQGYKPDSVKIEFFDVDDNLVCTQEKPIVASCDVCDLYLVEATKADNVGNQTCCWDFDIYLRPGARPVRGIGTTSTGPEEILIHDLTGDNMINVDANHTRFRKCINTSQSAITTTTIYLYDTLGNIICAIPVPTPCEQNCCSFNQQIDQVEDNTCGYDCFHFKVVSSEPETMPCKAYGVKVRSNATENGFDVRITNQPFSTPGSTPLFLNGTSVADLCVCSDRAGSGTITVHLDYLASDGTVICSKVATGYLIVEKPGSNYNGNNGNAANSNLLQVHPNPAKESVAINYDVVNSGSVEIELIGVDGKVVKTIEKSVKDAGSYTLNYDISSLARGVYYIRMTMNNQKTIAKLSVIK